MNFEKLTAYLDSLPLVGVPCYDCIVTLGHETVYRHMGGYTDTATGRKTAETDVYQLFSCSKPITCTAGVQLLEKGLMSLDDPVSRFLPEYEHMNVSVGGKIQPAQNVMTVRHLFTMGTGFGYDRSFPSLLSFIAENPSGTTREFVRALADFPLYFEPGTHYRYGFSIDILGAVIEQISGMTLGEYFDKYIFEPLDMHGITFHPTEEQKSRLAALYMGNIGTHTCTRVEGNDNDLVPVSRFESGGAGLYGTPAEYAKFTSALSCGGVGKTGQRILSEESVRSMGVNLLGEAGLKDFHNRSCRFGYGFGLCCRAHMNKDVSQALSPVGEFGWDSATGWHSLMDPINRVSIVFATHLRGYVYTYDRVHPTIRDLVYEGLEK